MTQVTRNHDDWLQSEFDMLTRACLRLKTHPTLSVLQSLDQISGAHTGMLLHYADQLEGLLESIGKHAGTLQRMAQGDSRAAAFSAVATHAVQDVERIVRPLIRTLRIKACATETPPSITSDESSLATQKHNPHAGQSWTTSSTADLGPDRILH